MLRALRFSAQLGFQVEEETFGAIRRLHASIGRISVERIQSELTKLLQTFGVQAVTQLTPEQLDKFAIALRDLGAKI